MPFKNADGLVFLILLILGGLFLLECLPDLAIHFFVDKPRFKKLNPRHLRIHFRKEVSSQEAGKCLTVIGANKWRTFPLLLIALLLVFCVFNAHVEGGLAGRLVLLLVGSALLFWGILMALTRVSLHENAIVVSRNLPFIRNTSFGRKIFMLGECDRLESSGIGWTWGSVKLFYSIIRDGKRVYRFNMRFFDLSVLEKTYTNKNPNVERIETLGKRKGL